MFLVVDAFPRQVGTWNGRRLAAEGRRCDGRRCRAEKWKSIFDGEGVSIDKYWTKAARGGCGADLAHGRLSRGEEG
jgi:hypothetical protein